MNCGDLRNSLLESADGMSLPQQVHLKSCRDCSALMADLAKISALASDLRDLDEPSPRVWNGLEVALRGEGLIRAQRVPKPFITSFGARWGRARWMVPAAAAVLIAVGVVEYRQSPSKQLADEASVKTVVAVADLNDADLNDNDLMQQVADRTPTVQAQYADGLRSINDSIRDAQSSLVSNPGDQEAHRALMEAYQQKEMLFEMAEDRPLP